MKSLNIKKNQIIPEQISDIQNDETEALVECCGTVVYPHFLSENTNNFLTFGTIKETGSRFYQSVVGQRVICWHSAPSQIQVVNREQFLVIPENVSDSDIVWLLHAASALHLIRKMNLEPGEIIDVIGSTVLSELIRQIASISQLNLKSSNTNSSIDAIIVSQPDKVKVDVELLRDGGMIVQIYPGSIDLNVDICCQKEVRHIYVNHFQRMLISDLKPDNEYYFSYGYCRWSDFRNIQLILKWIQEELLDLSGLQFDSVSFSELEKVDLKKIQKEALLIKW